MIKNIKMKKIIKIIVVILIGLILTVLNFNYLVFGELNFNGILRVLTKNTESNSFISYEKDFIYNHKIITRNVVNTTGIINYMYFLELNDIPKDVSLFTIELNSDNINYPKMRIYVHGDMGFSLYDEDNFYIDDNFKKSIIILDENIKKIIIESDLQISNSINDVNTEFLNIENIDINSKKDIFFVKENVLKDLFKSILFSLLIFAFIFLLFKTKIDKKILNINFKIEKIFLFLGIIFGIVFSVLFPLYQIPDELTHINLIYEEFNLNTKFENIIDSYGDTERIIGNYNEKVNIKEYFDLSKKFNFDKKMTMPNISFVKHLPQSFGLIVCSLLNLPVLVGITVAEVCAVLFYVIICYKTLKLMPIKKEMMMLVMLLPICIQQMGSFSYDAVLLPICFLFISYVMHLKFVKEKITLLDFVKLFSMLFYLSLIKIPYVMLICLLILLPIDKLYFNFKKIKVDGEWLKKYRKNIFWVLGVLGVLGGILVVNILKELCYGKILLASINANLSTIKLIFNTIKSNGFCYLNQLTGEFGWLETDVSIIFTLFVLFSLFIVSFFNTKSNKKEQKKTIVHF